MKHRFHPEALEEYEDSACYYAGRQEGLELRFIECVESTIRLILRDPWRWRCFEDDVRRCLTPVFPSGILYTIEEDFILIIAVMHCSREPGYWRHRIAT